MNLAEFHKAPKLRLMQSNHSKTLCLETKSFKTIRKNVFLREKLKDFKENNYFNDEEQIRDNYISCPESNELDDSFSTEESNYEFTKNKKLKEIYQNEVKIRKNFAYEFEDRKKITRKNNLVLSGVSDQRQLSKARSFIPNDNKILEGLVKKESSFLRCPLLSRLKSNKI